MALIHTNTLNLQYMVNMISARLQHVSFVTGSMLACSLRYLAQVTLLLSTDKRAAIMVVYC